MNYFFIILVLAICILITFFLVKESYTTEKSKKISFVIAVISALVTILSIVFSSVFLEQPNTNTNEIQNNLFISQEFQEFLERQEQFVTFDGLPCFILSKNFAYS